MSVELDPRSFELGKQVGEIKAWCEAARSGAKGMSLSAPFRPGDLGFLLPQIEEIAGRNQVSFRLERELMTTDLFGEMDLTGLWVFIIYKDVGVLEEYLSLKAEKRRLVSEDEYAGERRRDIASNMGRLLGYSEEYIDQRLASVKRK